MEPLFAARGTKLGICCHPYDICTELIARELGVIITDGLGRQLNAILSVEPNISWAGYANAAIQKQIDIGAKLLRRELNIRPAPLGFDRSGLHERFDVEEAGVRGRMMTAPIGTYAHRKSAGGKFRVKVFKMHVQEQLSSWPERKERRRRWVPVRLALKLISNPSLRRLISAQL